MKTAGERPEHLRPERVYGITYRDHLPIDPTGLDWSGTMVCGLCGWIHHQRPHFPASEHRPPSPLPYQNSDWDII